MQNEELIARLEAATSDSKKLMRSTWDALFPMPSGPQFVGSGKWGDWCDRKIRFVRLLDAEAYESAALTLVPERAGFTLDRYWIGAVDHPVWSAHITIGGTPKKPLRVFEVYDRATPALAICIAALRAYLDKNNAE